MIDAAERALLEATVVAALADSVGSADGVLAEVGWLEMLDAEPRDAVEVVFNALGTTNRTATALDDVLSATLGASPRADLAVLLPPFGAWTAPGGVGLTTSRVLTASALLVVRTAGTELRLATVPVSALAASAVQGIDPDLGLHVVRVTDTSFDGTTLGPDAWDSAVAAGRRAVAQQISGACRMMLALARTHALEREQFGRRIASFQAVRHRLAEALVAVEALDATLGAAGDEPNSMTAALAKATAGRTARTVAGHCQQVLAGIGFTTDHPFHRYLKRTMALDGLFGSTDAVTVDIGMQLIAARRVPTLVEL